MRIVLNFCAAALVFFNSVELKAEDLNEVLGRVNKYVQQGNYPKALEELSWARTEIEKLQNDKIKNFFPDSLAGFSGGKADASNALGMSNFERTYSKGETEVRLSLTSLGGGVGGGAGGLAALGRMAAMMGQQSGQETLRIAGRTATLTGGGEEGGLPELTVFLDSGSILKFEMTNGSDGKVLKTMAEAVKIEDLDSYLKGAVISIINRHRLDGPARPSWYQGLGSDTASTSSPCAVMASRNKVLGSNVSLEKTK